MLLMLMTPETWCSTPSHIYESVSQTALPDLVAAQESRDHESTRNRRLAGCSAERGRKSPGRGIRATAATATATATQQHLHCCRARDGKDAHPLGRWGEQHWKLETGGVVVGGRRGSAVSNRSGWVRQRGAGLLPPIIGCATPDSTSHWLPHPCTSSSSVVASFFRGFQYFGDWIANNRSWKPTPLSLFRIPPWSAVRSLARAAYPYASP
ncbi:hypothetical protein GQ607_010788 [Colletotrichum asianum]|uniref:Uncharacterized protein n=1 Tax=Colletotrichum asianum TaxID=702518 RepID=A0A8H3WA68_9PEZI|nr:hypothetical protein GQ607_010788 [Colletotrichum asianum]